MVVAEGLGISGFSGFSGFSGRSGFSGTTGSGTSGFSGISGPSGIAGVAIPGTSGFSGKAIVNGSYDQIYSCSSNDAVGAPVRFVGNRTVATTDSSNALNSMVFGFISEKITATACKVVHFYYHSGVSSFSGFSGYHGGAVYLTNNSGFSGNPGTSQKVIGESVSSIEALLNATPLSAVFPSYEYRNVIINGNLDLWQRIGSGSVSVDGVTTTAAYGPDRFKLIANDVSATFAISRSTDVPTFQQSGTISRYSVLLDCTATATPSGDDYMVLRYYIEGFDWAKIAHKPLILSFWVKSSRTGEHAGSLEGSIFIGVSHPFTYRINTADTWEKKIVSILPSDSTLAWDYDSAYGATLNFTLLVGTNFQSSTVNRWVSGAKFGTSNTVNLGAATSDSLRIAQIQLEAGHTPTTFEWRHISEELSMAQRYYRKTFALDTAPAQSGGTAGSLQYKWISNTGTVGYHLQFGIRMRTTPSMTFYNPANTNSNWRNVTTGADSGTSSSTAASDNGVTILNSSGSDTTGDSIAIHAAFDADY